jgi:hypothetical protein
MAEGQFADGRTVYGPICEECCRLLMSDPVLFWSSFEMKPPPLPKKRNDSFFQTPDDKGVPHRSDHIWIKKSVDGQTLYKCCLCGGITVDPPAFPTPNDWVPAAFELPLTNDERDMCPYLGTK